MFGAGSVTDDCHGGTNAAEVAKRFLKHARSHFRNGLQAKRFILRFDEVGVLIRKRATFRCAAGFKLFHFIEPKRVGMQPSDASVRSAASLDFFAGHAGDFGPFVFGNSNADAALVDTTDFRVDHRGLVGNALCVGRPKTSAWKNCREDEEYLFHRSSVARCEEEAQEGSFTIADC